MIVISNSLVLTPPATYEPNNPIVGWHNLVTAENVSSLSAAEDYPITNVANPLTAPGAAWRAEDVGDETVAVAVGTAEDIDYVGIARHNFGSAGIVVAIEGSSDNGVTWFELVEETLLPDDAPAIFRFAPQALTDIRLLLAPGLAAAELAVLYVGALLTLQRRIYVGHTPITLGRASRVLNGMSEAGDFLGRIVLSEETGTQVQLSNLTPSWYRQSLDPFIKASKSSPFFFAWRPAAYPREVGFAWMTNDPQPANQRPNGMMQVSLQMTGIAP